MKRKYLIILLCLTMLTAAQAQKLTVESMTVAGNDISASQYERKDLNNRACALVKVLLPMPGAVFEGNVIGSVDFKTGEYWVYMTEGSKELRIKHPQTQPLQAVFKDYGVDKLTSKTTYTLSVLLPQAAASVQMQKLVINYTPATAMVLVDAQPYQGNGHLELMLPIGNHDYQVAAMGYVANSGSVTLTAAAPRTITENLSKVATQQSVSQVPQQPTVQQASAQQPSVQQQPQQVQSVTIEQPAQNAAVETFTVNGVSFSMVRVDGGTFTMGATKEQGKDAEDNEKPAHQVTLSTYSIGETEVTQALWQAVMGSTPSKFKGDNLPVECVSWEDCQTFISKLNEMTARKFRLPTEAEWEYAARGGNKSRSYKYSGSNSLDDVAWYYNNSTKTHTVKTKQANELGLYDMSGNVWEWCQDWSGSYSRSSQLNPTGPSSGSYRVFRGGCWIYSAGYCRVSFRNDFIPSMRDSNLGFRLALSHGGSLVRKCDACNGWGVCFNCNGTGLNSYRICVDCGGSGKCSSCAGQGYY